MRQITRIAIVAGACCGTISGQTGIAPITADVLVIGAGPGGLSTALEAGQRGLRVTVVDVSSVFGGHAVVSEGILSHGAALIWRQLALQRAECTGAQHGPVPVPVPLLRANAEVGKRRPVTFLGT